MSWYMQFSSRRFTRVRALLWQRMPWSARSSGKFFAGAEHRVPRLFLYYASRGVIAGTENGASPRVGVKHKFDAVGWHIGSMIFAVGPSAAPPGDDASSDTPLSGGNTWDAMDRLASSSCV